MPTIGRNNKCKALILDSLISLDFINGKIKDLKIKYIKKKIIPKYNFVKRIIKKNKKASK